MADKLKELYEDFDNETTIDLSSNNLETVPDSIYNNKSATMMYLQNNKIQMLPDDFFHSFLNLNWLDLRGNQLQCIPTTIKNHPSLTHLLLQDNNISSLPNELGTVLNLKVLQLNGNPLVYPPKEIINLGTNEIIKYLYSEFLGTILDVNSNSDKTSDFEAEELSNVRSYNSVLDASEIKNRLKVHFNEKDESEYYDKMKGKCHKLAISRRKNVPHTQSSKYLQPIRIPSKVVQDQRILQSYLKDKALQNKKDFIARADKIIQEKKNMELLRNWRKNYRNSQFIMSNDTKIYSEPRYPYDTNPEYMKFLTREELERDLPDKFRKKLVVRSKPTVPRKLNNDVHLAMKIKKLFENLEAIDLQTNEMTPRTEQKVLLNEIQKITEIKQKLSELSTTNSRSVIDE